MIVAITLGCVSATPDSRPTTRSPLPSPLAGPGGPHLDSVSSRAIERGVSTLREGQTQKARSQTAKARGTAQGELLELQIAYVQDGSGLVPQLEEIIDEEDDKE